MRAIFLCMILGIFAISQSNVVQKPRPPKVVACDCSLGLGLDTKLIINPVTCFPDSPFSDICLEINCTLLGDRAKLGNYYQAASDQAEGAEALWEYYILRRMSEKTYSQEASDQAEAAETLFEDYIRQRVPSEKISECLTISAEFPFPPYFPRILTTSSPVKGLFVEYDDEDESRYAGKTEQAYYPEMIEILSADLAETKSAYYPEIIEIFPGEKTLNRHKRTPAENDLPCKIPIAANSRTRCQRWKNWMSCIQTCVYGHGVATGHGTVTERYITCRRAAKKWLPHPFQDCKRYLNCKVALAEPYSGYFHCVPDFSKPTWCEIECYGTNRFPGTKLKNYTCDGRGESLPPCVVRDETVLLIDPPNHDRAAA